MGNPPHSKKLSGPAPSPDGKLLKITMYLKKLPKVTDEYFHAYWANNHVAPALEKSKFRRNVVRYNQYHITPELRNQVAALGVPVLEYDGVAEVWVRSLQDWIDAISDAELTKELDGDDLNFLQQPIHITMGYDHLILGDGGAPPLKAKL